jgi:fimbrial isopeptide formation D2 family protein
MTDRIPDGLRFDDSVSGDGTPSFNNSTFTVDFGSISAGSSKTVEFAARVQASSGTICNVAKAPGNNVSQVEDEACVKIIRNNPGTPNIVISKRAWNDTKNVDATSVNAARGDYITYTLVATNTGSADQTNYRFEDDLSQVLPLADMVSTNGGTMSSTWITYPAMTIKAGETVTKTFKVRIKQTLSSELSYQLRNTYGNTIVINVPGNKIYVPPVTGAAGNSAAAFAGLVTAGFVIVRKRGSILKFIFA